MLCSGSSAGDARQLITVTRIARKLTGYTTRIHVYNNINDGGLNIN